MGFSTKRKPVAARKLKTKLSWLPKILLGLLLTTILGSIYYFITSGIFAVKNLEVKADKVNCTSTTNLKNSSQILGKNIFFIDKSRIEKKLKERYICVKSIGISRILPDKIKVDIFVRVTAAQILVFPIDEASSSAILNDFLMKKSASESAEVSPQPQKYFTVDYEGVIFSEDRVPDKPKLFVWDDSLKVGQKINKEIISRSLEVIKKIEILTIKVTETKLYSNKYLLIDAEPKLIFDLSNNIKTQLASLQLILSRAKIEEKEMEFIDLRFENPIVKYAPKKGEK